MSNGPLLPIQTGLDANMVALLNDALKLATLWAGMTLYKEMTKCSALKSPTDLVKALALTAVLNDVVVKNVISIQ